ncbi:hypothetical protein, partial [Micromonospora sp. AMSO31t]|uniref:hypothetical protein n=1 Tax=Micromonospora sp. AMSO31t TaxID=2650566 RepID=UPI00124BBCAA
MFSNALYAVEILGWGDNRTANLQAYSNTFSGYPKDVSFFASGYGWSSNTTFFGNVSTEGGGLDSSLLKGQWFGDDASNQYPAWDLYDDVGRTNTISYAHGMRQRTWVNVTNSVLVLEDRNAA